MKALLTLTSSSDVKAGVEVFNDQLKSVFKDLEFIHMNSAKGFNISMFKEPMIARRICKLFMKRLKENDIEVVFTSGMNGWKLDVDIPIINIQHGGYAGFADAAMKKSTLNYWRTRYIYSHFEKLSAKNSDVVISNSEFTRDCIKRYYGVDSKVIENPIDTEIFKPVEKTKARKAINLPLNKKIVLFVGRAHYSKGFDIVEDLARMNKDMLFVCIINTKVTPNIRNMRIYDSVSQDKLRLFYSAADFLIFPSRFEGFGYVPLEALACNTAIIANSVGIIKNLKIRGCTVVNNNNIDEYQEALKNQPEKENYNKYIKNRFSFNKFSRSYKEVVKGLV